MEDLVDLLKVGEIATTHGVHGELKAFPTTDDAARFKKLKKCKLETKQGLLDLDVVSCKFFKQFVILKFKQFDNINEVEQFRHCGLFVTRENAVKCQKDEYFIADLIGLRVYDEDNVELGELKDVLQTGANDVYVIELLNQQEVLLPAIKQCILDIDIKERKMKVHILEGLLS